VKRYALGALMIVARCAAVLGFLVIGGVGCNHRDCSAVCEGNQAATFQLSCAPTNLTSVALSGVCSIGDAGPSNVGVSSVRASVFISSASPGECHVVLTFATGFAYSADVTFTVQTDPVPAGCGTCPYTVPNKPSFTVNNPPATCVDEGLDAGGDAFPDAPSATAEDADGDAGVDG
jgi:hypothetical protein